MPAETGMSRFCSKGISILTTLTDFIVDKDYDIVCLTETCWKQDTNCSVRTPPGYTVIHLPRFKLSGKSRGGGVAIMFVTSGLEALTTAESACDF